MLRYADSGEMIDWQAIIQPRSQMPVHKCRSTKGQFTNARSRRPVHKRNAKMSCLPEGQKRYFMTISAKSRNRDCPVTEIKELTSFFETSTRRAESTINVHSSRKRQENRQERQETAKTGPSALRLKAGSRSRPCVVRAPDGVLERICARPRRLSHFATAERGLPSTPLSGRVRFQSQGCNQTNARHRTATANVTRKANTSGIRAPMVVHFALRVSRQIVRMVVAQGL